MTSPAQTSSGQAGKTPGKPLLEGLRVVEMGIWVAGPAVGGILADWGADVVKLESPLGDPMRRMGQVVAGLAMPSSPPFNLDNRGKRSIVLDLKHEEGRQHALDLVARADVFVTNYRGEALQRLGLDWASLEERAPRLVYAHVTGYGQEGPDAGRPAYDVGAFWARAGIATLLRPHGHDEPIGIRGGFGDHTTATHALAGIMAALFARERTGRGQLVDACLLRSGAYTVGWDMGIQLEYGRLGAPGPRTKSAMPTSIMYRAGDGRYVQLLGLEADRHWPVLLEALDRKDLKDDPRFATAVARRENATLLMPILDAELARRPLDEWLARFDACGMWWAPVQTPGELVEDPQAHAAGVFVDVPESDGTPAHKSVASPLRFSSADTTPTAGPPALGAHTDEVLRDLGVPDDAITDLRARGVLG